MATCGTPTVDTRLVDCLAEWCHRSARETLWAMAPGLFVVGIARFISVSSSSLRHWQRDVLIGTSLEPGTSPGGPGRSQRMRKRPYAHRLPRMPTPRETRTAHRARLAWLVAVSVATKS
jgi:hypothetical protein